MRAAGFDTPNAYREHLEQTPSEFRCLIDTMLINVTTFFRDAPAWDVVRTTVVPRLVGRTEDCATIRVWSAGCSSGQEAYTIAIVLADALGVDAYREQAQAKVLARFHFALTDGGYLMLGRAESLLTHHGGFAPVDLRRRIFTKVPRGSPKA